MNSDEQLPTVANASTNPFVSPVANIDDQVEFAAVHEAPPLKPARLLSIQGVLSVLLVVGVLSIIPYSLTGDKALVPSIVNFQVALLAIWLGVGRGPLGVRLLVTAGAYFYFRYLIQVSNEYSEDVMQPTTIFLFGVASLLGLVDLTLLAITPASRAQLKVTALRLFLAMVGLMAVGAAWNSPIQEFLNIDTLTNNLTNILRILGLLCPLVTVVAMPLVFRKHGRTRGKWITTLSISAAIIFLTTYAMHFDLGNPAFFFLIVAPIVQFGMGIYLYALDYLLRCCGLSLVPVPTTGEIKNG